jgi:hypothetical protein
VADDSAPGTRLESWISMGATIVAPTTLFGGLLFYFGYVSSRSQYAYFGIDVDTIGLGTRDYVMRSPQPLLVPLLVLTLVGAGCLTLNTAIRALITSAIRQTADPSTDAEPDPMPHVDRVRHVVRWSRALGLAMLAIGVVLLMIYAYIGDWALYALVTPLLIALGGALATYTSRLLNLLSHQQAAVTATGAGLLSSPVRSGSSVIGRRIARVLVYVVIAASIFWATATIAQWSGLGLAKNSAQHLDSLPSVILDTKERLFLRDPGIEETVLPPSEGQTFHYRYRGLRLLIEGQNRMFLVPDQWSASDSTLIVPLDGSVRVQFQFQNQPP